jgi:hypothetical protein
MNARTPRFLMLAALALAAVPLSASPAKSHEEKTLPAPARAVAVLGSFHDVEVAVKPGDKVRVTVDMEISASSDAKAEELIKEYAPTYVEKDGTLTIRSRRKSEAGFNWGYMKMQGRIVLEMPPDLDLTLDTASGDCVLNGDLGKGKFSADVASGEIRVKGAAAELKVEAASGSFTGELSRPAAAAAFDMASGDVDLTGPVGSFKADTASGNVTVTGLTGPAVFDVASGDVKAEWTAVAPGTKVTADSASGSVTLVFPAGAVLGGMADTASGDVESDFPGTLNKRGNTFAFTGGPDAVELKLDAASGDITVRKAGKALAEKP